MSYCTQTDLIERFGESEIRQLSDRHNVGDIDADVVARAIADADGEIDGYLGGRFTLPLANVPTVLVRVACDIARYYLYDDAVSEQVVRRYNDARDFLRSAGRGDISLGVDANGAAPVSDNTATLESGGSVFNRSDKGFI